MQETWYPFPKQEFALQRAEDEVLFGGSRGPGKTDAGLVWLIGEEYAPGKVLLDHPKYRALVIRKNADDLADWIDRAHWFYSSFGVDIAYKPAVLRFPSGAIIRTGHLKDDQSYTKYQGQEFPRILIEELTQIPLEKRYLQLIASCRSTIPEIKPQVFATTNPGGLGHLWVKNRFVDPYPMGMVPFEVGGRTKIFIPATVDDNPILTKVDPNYVKMLDALKETDEELWKAWRLGDWNTFAGQFFKSFNTQIHVIPRYILNIKKGYLLGSLDWGRQDNFAFYIHHIFPVTYQGQTFYRIVTFMEVYGNEKYPKEWAKIIKNRLDGYNLTISHLSSIQSDNQIFSQSAVDVGKTIADHFYEFDPQYNGMLQPASKNRIAGWENIQNWLSMAPDGYPYWQIHQSCVNLIRTLPAAVHDENKVEDIDQGGEDDALDSVRYGFMGLKWINAKVEGSERSGIIKEEKTVIQEDKELFDDE